MEQLILQSSSAKQTIVDYINAANQVCCYAVSINTIGLPALVTPPDKYGDYASTLAQAKIHVMKWMEEVTPTFENIPAALLSLSSVVQPQLKLIQTNLKTLKNDPTNSTAKQAIINAVNQVIQKTASSKTMLGHLDTWITTYQGNITPDATALGQLSASITTAEKADQDSIDKLHTAYNTLQSVIDDRNELATLNTVSNVILTVWLSVVGAAVGLPFSTLAGAVVGGVVGIVTGVTTQFVPIHNDADYQQTLKQIQDQMSSISSEIGLMNTTISLLQKTSDQFNTLVAQSGQASDQAKVVLSFWQNLENDLTKLVTDLNDILSNLQPDTIDKALTDIQDAQTSWADLVDFAEGIKGVTYNISPTYVPPAT